MAVRRPTLTAAEFRRRFPEFLRPTDVVKAAEYDTLVASTLRTASRSIDADLWGDVVADGEETPAKDGGYTLTAHLLAMSPFGQTARLSSNGDSTYGVRYRQLRAQVAIGPRAI